MFNNFWFKKEKPLPTMIGMGGGATGLSQNSGVSYGSANYEPITVYAWGGGALGVPGDTPLQPRSGFAEIIIDGTSFPSEYTRLEVWSGGGGSPSGSGSSDNEVFGGGGGGCCPGGAGPDLGSSGGGGTFVFLGNPTMDAVFNPGGTALNIPVADADARCILAAGGMGGKQRASGGVAGGPGGGLVATGNGGTLSGTAPQVSRGGGGDAYIGQNGAPGGPLGSGGGGGGYEGGHTNTDESGWGGCGYVGHIDPTGAGSRANPYSGTSPVNDVVYTHGVTLGGRNESSTGPLAPTGYNPGSLYANPAKSSQFFPGADTSGNLNGNIGCPLPNGGAAGYAIVSQLNGSATCPGGNLTTYNLVESPAATQSAKASGGTIFECGSYTVHRFDVSPTSQTFTTPGSFSETCEYVIIAGGGAGGNDAAGGGGAGQYLTGPTPIGNSASISITVGSGGAGAPAPGANQGGDGNDSSAAFPTGTISANGGGGGGNGGSGSQTPGRDGGSGGGGGQRNSKPGGSATPGPGGNDGGASGPGSGARSGGGGGGAGGAGITGGANPADSPTNTCGANGGAGIQLPATFRDPTAPPARILGCPGPGSPTPLHWVAGGGGGAGDHKGGRGGIGANPTEVNNSSEANVNNSGLSGGGDAGSQGGFSYAYPGVPGTGGGGGGANFATPGGNGGDGIVLIAYPT